MTNQTEKLAIEYYLRHHNTNAEESENVLFTTPAYREYKNKIPFRYECSLKLGDFTYYPDFTIRHPKTGETYYWEHFCKMDDADYSKNVFSKLQHYTSHGIVPTIQLITTYETKNNPFTINNAEKIVNDYFL